jgi:hypothetical protein
MNLTMEAKFSLLEKLADGMILEFPHLGEFDRFVSERRYTI